VLGGDQPRVLWGWGRGRRVGAVQQLRRHWKDGCASWLEMTRDVSVEWLSVLMEPRGKAVDTAASLTASRGQEEQDGVAWTPRVFLIVAWLCCLVALRG
jgi:hypothetical protein